MNKNYQRKQMHNLAEIFKRQKANGKSQKEAADFLNIDHRSVLPPSADMYQYFE